MTDAQAREASRQFIKKWKGKGNEDEDARSYWIDIYEKILGGSSATDHMQFEKKVKIDGHTKKIDVYVPDTHVLIEQKSLGIPLDKQGHQSDNIKLTPYEQAKRYNDNLPYDEKARWIITSNFAEIWIYDMNVQVPEPIKIRLSEIQAKYPLLSILVSQEVKKLSEEMELSIKAGDIVGKIYDAFLEQYDDPKNPDSLKSLNALCVRLVFCLYAEDAGIFGRRNMFHDFLEHYDTEDCREKLIQLFKVLDQKEDERDRYLKKDIADFPYVNGGLFEDEGIEIPPFTDDIKRLLLQDASANFDWSGISPTIFGAVFESTLNPETRRSGGMHYTSITNIHKVIDPLFLDELKAEFEKIKGIKAAKTRKDRLDQFQDKLAGLTFLDPACGSGNFLTETYISIRRVENEVLKEKIAAERGQIGGQMTFGFSGSSEGNPIRVSIRQFYGIEINDFATTVAKTALWIAESQMMRETEDVIHDNLEFLPLKTNAHIVEGNALRTDWNEVVPARKLDYIMGNPPFVGSSRLSEDQKKDRSDIFGKSGGELDYVSCWYKKTSDYIGKNKIACAFVSTNSICQGQQIYPLWNPLSESGIRINFAHRTFVWDSEANIKAHVYCVIIGFSRYEFNKIRKIFDGETIVDAANINGYLMDAPDVFIRKRRKPLSQVPLVIKGFQPTDNGCLVLSDDEKEELLAAEPKAEKWIRQFITAREFIHGKNRWCLWLVGIEPRELHSLPKVRDRVMACHEWRSAQTKTGDAYKLKDTPTLMRPSKKFKDGDFIVLPRHSGERRRYIPFGYVKKGSIPGDSISILPEADLYHFGVLCSNVHMAWMRAVCGRLKGDYRYTSDIVYNNFIWPDPDDKQHKAIEDTAQMILDARTLYPNSSLDELYDPIMMPPELSKAHNRNNAAVMKAYGFSIDMSEAECVAELMKMYKEFTENT